jgi:hypothetical protein
MDFKQILKDQFKDLITEETLTAVHEAFEAAVEEKANKRAELQVEAAVTKLDDDHAQKLSQLIESIDEDHTTKLQRLVESIDFDHAQKLKKVVERLDDKYTGMLKQVIEKYETTLKEEAETYRNRLVDEISNYLDLYIDKTLPKEQISEAVENIRARKVVHQIRQLVGINEEFINDEVKEALVDGKKTIDSLKKELNEALEKNTKINHELQKVEASFLLEQKTKELPDSAKAYVTKLLKGKSPEYIQENFQYVVEMFEKEITEQEEKAQDTISQRIVESVDRPEAITESEVVSTPEPAKADPSVGGYLSEMKRLDGSRLKLRY